jgi:hypothetical protein
MSNFMRNLSRGKKVARNVGDFFNSHKMEQYKKSANGRKFAQFDHTDSKLNREL